MGTVVSLPKLSPLEKQLVSEGKLDRSALSSRASCKIRTLSREQQQAVFTQCQGLLNNIKESKDKQRAETEAALKVEWQDGESVSTEEAEDIVQTCWSRINRQCAQYYRKKNSNKTVTGWRVVRVFVSSTFADFFSEREALVKKVFPELKEWCETRQLQLIECDLRWGVPKDTTTGETIATCLEEIDRCLDETDGEPFFLGMLGERYGWNPTSREVPQDIIHKYEWVPNLSMTHMEILHGAIRNQNPNAVFMLRDPCYLSDIPPDHLKNFLEEDELPKSQLKELKRYLHEEFSDSVFEYSCDVDGVDDSTGREVIQLSKLDEFCEHVLTFFKAAIERTYPHSEHTLTPQQEENEQHRNYVLQKGSTVFGRDRVITNILRFAEGDNQGITDENISLQSSIRDSDTISSSDDIVMNHLTNGELLDSDKSDEQNGDIRVVVENYSSDVGSDSVNSKGSRQRTNMRVRQSRAPSDSWLLVVVGSPGTGKSALMARTVMNAEKAGLDIFYHFVGSCPSSIHYDNLIKRLCKYLLSADDERLVKLDGEYSEEEIIKLLPTLLKERSSRREQLLIVIDAVNQLSDGKETSHLQWLPATISGIYVKCVVSTVENARSLQILHDLSPSPWELIVRPLNTSTRIDIVQHYLGRYSKRLDPNQLALLTKCDGAKNALWLTLACEELRVFGVFERLTQRIQTLPGKLEGLLSDILNRLVKEDLTDCIAKVLSLLYCSQAGLLETELQMLLGDVESNTPLPMLPWAQVRRTLKPFLRNIGLVGGVERWDFFHQSIAKAVEDHWLQDVENRKNCHLELADFYQYYNNNNFAVTQNLPYHLQRAGQIQRMVEFFQKDQRSLQMNQAHKSQYLRQFRCQRQITNVMAGFGKKLMICHFCQLKQGAFNPGGFQNHNCCVICGGFVHFKKDDSIAYLCQFHMPRTPPSCDSCFLCNKMFPGGGPVASVTGYVCVWCRYTPFSAKCVKILTENDKY